jgi:hypothetical protein
LVKNGKKQEAYADGMRIKKVKKGETISKESHRSISDKSIAVERRKRTRSWE